MAKRSSGEKPKRSKEGKEVAQVYYRQRIDSVTTPVKRLFRFKKVALTPGSSMRVSFDIPVQELAVWNPSMKREVEPGTFDLMIGSSSESIALKSEFEVQ